MRAEGPAMLQPGLERVCERRPRLTAHTYFPALKARHRSDQTMGEAFFETNHRCLNLSCQPLTQSENRNAALPDGRRGNYGLGDPLHAPPHYPGNDRSCAGGISFDLIRENAYFSFMQRTENQCSLTALRRVARGAAVFKINCLSLAAYLPIQSWLGFPPANF